MTTTRRSALTALALLLAAGATGCGAIVEEVAEQAIESETGEDVEIDLSTDDDGATFSMQTEEGTVQFDTDEDGGTMSFDGVDGEEGQVAFGDEAELPDCVDGILSLPSGLDVQSAVTADDFCMVVAVVTSGESIEELADRFEADIDRAGFTESTSRSSFSTASGEQFAVSGASTDGGQVGVTIGTDANYLAADGTSGEATILSITVS